VVQLPVMIADKVVDQDVPAPSHEHQAQVGCWGCDRAVPQSDGPERDPPLTMASSSNVLVVDA
jgi:hypothetical protein